MDIFAFPPSWVQKGLWPILQLPTAICIHKHTDTKANQLAETCYKGQKEEENEAGCLAISLPHPRTAFDAVYTQHATQLSGIQSQHN